MSASNGREILFLNKIRSQDQRPADYSTMKAVHAERSFLVVVVAPSFLLLLFLVVNPLPLCEAWWRGATKEDGAIKAPQPQRNLQSEPSLSEPVEYGVDVSWPMHREHCSSNYAWLEHNTNPDIPTPSEYKGMPVQPLGDRESFYQKYVKGCVDHYGKRGQRCVTSERDRVAMSLRQPQSMKNYTTTGYKKIRAPEFMFKLIKKFWEQNKNKKKNENWGTGNSYVNHWEEPTFMVSVEDSSLRGGGYQLKKAIWDAARDTIQEWTGQELTQCSLYGVRVYQEGAVLATHVDRLPLVSSAIVNVDQDLDEPWPLEVIGHDGKATNVTMEPGDMVLYESHSVLHGRPFPLKGRYMANIFIHFEPVGHSLRHHNMVGAAGDVDERYREARENNQAGHENNEENGLPPYVMAGTPEEPHWRSTHPGGYKSKDKAVETFSTGSTVTVHKAAQRGQLKDLQDLVEKKKADVNARDKNGWTPLHEGVRSGHLDVVMYLVQQGADKDAAPYKSGTALWLAKKNHAADHPVVQFLESIGATEAGPEL